jgi:integrase
MGNAKGRRRRFGAVRQLPSGQWQVRYRGPDGLMRPAPQTFRSKTSAVQWLTRTEADILDGDWIDPDTGLIPFGEYAAAWVEERDLRPNTAQMYRYVLARHLNPVLGSRAIAEIKEPQVRRWRKGLLDSGVSIVSAAKAYRLLKAIMNTAVDDGIIRRNPCRIKGAAQDRSPERPMLTPRQVFALADAVHPRYRALILLAVFASLRWGELAALRRADIDLRTGTVKIARSLNELPGGGYRFGPPKTDAGRRVVAFPAIIKADLAWHLARFTAHDDDALIFTSPTGMPLRRGNFRRRVWIKAVEATGIPGVHFHDLRHSGNNLTAQAGANLRELMERMGHSSTRAALIYLHATTERQRALADILSTLIESAMTERAPGQDSSGTNVARGRQESIDTTKPRPGDLG